MKSSLLKNWWILLIKGIILIMLAIFVFSSPGEAIIGLSVFIGIGLFLSGIVHASSAFMSRKVINHWGWYFAEGLVDLFFGILFLAKPQLTASILVIMIGFWFLIYAVLRLILSFHLKEGGIKNWWGEMIWGVLGVLIGMLIIINPFAGLLTIVWLLGLFFLVAGILNVVFAFFLKKSTQENT